MDELTSIERANESNWLWPPIADAVDTFLRRREDADGYERIWRLIHVWESIVTTLTAVAVARLRTCEAGNAIYFKARELLHGVSWDAIDNRLKSSQGALHGANDKRIELLRLVHQAEGSESDFLDALKQFLDFDGIAASDQEAVNDAKMGVNAGGEDQHIDLHAFVDMWKRACDVPPNLDQARDARHKVIEVMGFINTFRNRYAHVPFPYDPLEAIADALETVTAQLFWIMPTAWSAESVLTGGIVRKRTMWRGGLPARYSGKEGEGLEFAFPPRKTKEVWRAEPFVYIDKNKRPYVLTRLKNADTGTWEYTRYRAEANAVLTHDDEGMLGLVPAPTEQDYQREDDIEIASRAEEAQGKEQAVEPTHEEAVARTEPRPSKADAARRFSNAIEAIRNGNYDEAILFFENLARKEPGYHISWLRLGHARREKAARLRFDDSDQAIKLLHSSVEAFNKATPHRDPEYQATAYYERSKAYHRLWSITNSEDAAESARRDAVEACQRSADTRYQTWLEYLERMMPLAATKK